MKVRTVTLLLALLGMPAHASCPWPLWTQFKQHFIEASGRVIDPNDARVITTSEGQAYALFFALVAGDRQTFGRLLRWSQDNLANGDLGQHLPAWLWGRAEDGRWRVLDTNSAADADLWLAYSLQEAGRLWQQPGYGRLSARLLRLIERHEIHQVPYLGPVLLPGAQGFSTQDRWTLNPSYSPPFLLRSFAHHYPGGPWPAMLEPTRRLLEKSSARGFVPDWIDWQDGQWQAARGSGWQGSYDAIRVYLWLGMQAEEPESENPARQFLPMLRYLEGTGHPPLRVDSQQGLAEGQGPAGFSAALLPLLARADDPDLLEGQLLRLRTQPLHPKAYYDHVLSLFGLGWHEGRYRFSAEGDLHLQGAASCR